MKRISLKKILCASVAVASLYICPVLASPSEGAPSSVNWSGPYIGAHVGDTWGDFRGEGGLAGPNGSSSNFMGGGQIGNNWQSNRIVFGVEGDISALDMESRNPSTTFDEDWMATMRGRVGYSMNRYLPYVTAGLGLTDVVSKAPGLGADSRVQPGIAAGGGVDFLLADQGSEWSHWFGRVEYLYTDVPKDTTFVGGTTVAGGSSNNTLRLGLNYKF